MQAELTPAVCRTLQDGQFCPSTQPAWSALRSQCFGYSVLELINATHALWEMTCQDNPAGQASDSVYLVHGDYNASCATMAVNEGPVYYGTTGADATCVPDAWHSFPSLYDAEMPRLLLPHWGIADMSS